MKKMLMFILCMGLCFDIISDSQTLSSDVSFSASPFVRIGFSSNPVESAVEPIDSLKRDTASFVYQDRDRAYVTGNYYLYTQIFSVDKVQVTIEEAKPLYSNRYHIWNTTFIPWGKNQSILSEVGITSGINFQHVLLFAEDDSIETAFPRTYCWVFNVIIPEAAAPAADARNVESGLIKVVVASME